MVALDEISKTLHDTPRGNPVKPRAKIINLTGMAVSLFSSLRNRYGVDAKYG